MPERDIRASVATALVRASVLLVAIITAGAVGYVVLSDLSVAHALWMTSATLASIGQVEPYPVGSAGRHFTRVLTTVSIGALAYAGLMVAQAGLHALRPRRSSR